MSDPTRLTRNDISRLLLMRNAGFGGAAMVGTFLTLYRVASGSWPLTGGAGEGMVSLAPSGGVVVVLGLVLLGAAYVLRGNQRVLLTVGAVLATIFGLLAFAKWVGVGLVMQMVWLLVFVSIGCVILGVWSARRVWYARRPKRWYRRLERLAEREREREARKNLGAEDDDAPVILVNHAPPTPRRPAEPLVVNVVDLDGIDLSDDLDEQPADQQGR